MVPDRRAQPRLPVVWKASLIRLDGQQLPGSTDNVSLDGVNIILDQGLTIGEPVHLHITSCVDGTKRWHRLHGLVVYVEELPGHIGYSTGMVLRKCPDDFAQQVLALEQSLLRCGFVQRLA